MDDFLITEADLAQRFDESENSRHVREKLLVRQEGDAIDLALYLDAAIVEHLNADDPTKRLYRGNLVDFMIALEGVSHFLYVAWNAMYEKHVSLLELELQAEIDKYIVAAYLLARQSRGCVPRGLHHWLFDEPLFDPTLQHHERQRYSDASYFAGKYCHHLERRYMGKARPAEMFRELRRFYRLPRIEKIRRIEQAV